MLRKDGVVGEFLLAHLPYFVVVAVVIVSVTVLRKVSVKFNDMFTLIFYVPFFMVTIKLDDLFAKFNPFQRFPRNAGEVMDSPRGFFNMVKKNDLPIFQKAAMCRGTAYANPHLTGALHDAERAVPKNAVMTSFERLEGISSEPLKNAQLGIFNVGYTVPATTKNADGTTNYEGDDKKAKKKASDDEIRGERRQIWFTKYSSERKVSLFLKGLGSAFLPVCNEVNFYRHIAPQLSVVARVPTCIAAFNSRSFNRMCIVLDYIPHPWATCPDWKGATPGQMEALVGSAAACHARFWRPSDDHPNLAFIRPNNRVGLGWLDLVKMYIDKSPEKWLPVLWNAMNTFFSKEDLACLSHADCRPGNMMFAKTTDVVIDGKTGQKKAVADLPTSKTNPTGLPDDVWEIVMSDWEAVSVTPFLWDFTYATTIGQSTKNRHELFDAQLRFYLETLFDRNKTAQNDLLTVKFGGDFNALVAYCKKVRVLLVGVIFYFGLLLSLMEGVGKTQGNTEEDCLAWNDRIGQTLVDLLDDKTIAELTNMMLAADDAKKHNAEAVENAFCKLRSSAVDMVDRKNGTAELAENVEGKKKD